MNQSVAGRTATASTPVGTWREELLLERGTYTSTLRFTPNGRTLLLAGPRPGCVGAGTWTATGAGRFSFRLAELVFDPDGTFTGWVDIEQHVVQTETPSPAPGSPMSTTPTTSCWSARRSRRAGPAAADGPPRPRPGRAGAQARYDPPCAVAHAAVGTVGDTQHRPTPGPQAGPSVHLGGQR